MRINVSALAARARSAPPGTRWLPMLFALMAFALPTGAQQATILNPHSKIVGTVNTPEWISNELSPLTTPYIINGTCVNADSVQVKITGPNAYSLTGNAVVKHGVWEYKWYLTSNGTPTGTLLPGKPNAGFGPYTIQVTPLASTSPGTPSSVTVNIVDATTTNSAGALSLLPSTFHPNLFVGTDNITPNSAPATATTRVQIHAFANGVPLTSAQVVAVDPTGSSSTVLNTTFDTPNPLSLNNDSATPNAQVTGLPLNYTIGAGVLAGVVEGVNVVQLELNSSSTYIFQRSVLVDLTAPAVTNTVNVTYVNTSNGVSVVFSGTAKDIPGAGPGTDTPVSGVGSVELSIAKNGVGTYANYAADLQHAPILDINNNVIEDDVTWHLTLPPGALASGTYTIALTARDNAGNSATATNNSVGVNPALLQVNSFTASAPAALTTAKDPGATISTSITATITGGVNPVTWTLTDSGTSVLGTPSNTGTAVSSTWTLNVGDESDHTLTLTATDAQGQTVTQRLIVPVDTKRPVVTLNTLPGFVTGVVKLTGLVTDRNPATWKIVITGPGGYTNTINNTDGGISPPGTPTSVVYNWDTSVAVGGVTPADGVYTITLSAVDTFGNVSTTDTTPGDALNPSPHATASVTLENTKPNPSFTSPAAFVPAVTTPSGAIMTPATGLYNFAQSPVSLAGSLGLNTTLNDNSATVAVTVDGVTTNVTQPTANYAGNTFGGGSFTLTNGEEKLHQATVKVTNSAGVSNSNSVSFYVDTLAPRVDLTTPSSNQPVSGTVVVTGTVTDANPQDWTLTITGPGGYSNVVKFSNNDPNAAASTSTSVAYLWNTKVAVGGVTPADGNYTIKLTGTDQAGNTTVAGAASVPVVLVNNSPTPVFTLPVKYVPAVTTANGAITTPATGLYGVSPLTITGNIGLPANDTSETVAYTLDGVDITKIAGTPVTIMPIGTYPNGKTTDTFNGTYNLTAGEEKLHTLTVSVTNSANVTGPLGSVTFFVDTLAPRVAITTPSSNQPVSGKVVITGTVTDATPKDWTLSITGPGGYSNVVKFSDGNPAAASSTTTSVNYLWDTKAAVGGVTPADGSYTIKLTGTDQAGNTTVAGAASVPVVLGNNSPTPTFTLPVAFVPAVTAANGAITTPATGLYGVSPLTITGNIGLPANDTSETVAYTLDGVDITKIAGTPVTITPTGTYPNGKTTDTFNGTYNLTAGEEKLHTLTVSVTNSANVTGPLGSVTFFVDTLAPRVAITAPSNNQSVAGKVVITGTVTDANPKDWTLAITGPGGYSNTVKFSDGNPAAAASTTTAVSYTWDTTTTPADGSYTIKLTGTDQAGNTTATAASIAVVVGNNAAKPVFTLPVTFVQAVTAANGAIITPATGLYGVSPLTITGNLGFPAADTNDKATYTLDGVDITTIAGTPVTITSPTNPFNGAVGEMFNGTYNLTKGEEKLHTLTVSVTNSAGITGPLGSVTFYVDTLAPRVAITSPSSNQPVSGKVVITGTVTDANPQEWILNIVGPGGYTSTVKFSDNNANAAASTATSVNYLWDTKVAVNGVTPADGNYTIRLIGKDQVGNTTPTAVSVPVVLGNTGPQPVFTLPVKYVPAVTTANGTITTPATGLYGVSPMTITGSLGLKATETNASATYTLDGVDITTISGMPVSITPHGTGIAGDATTKFNGTYNLTAGEEKLHTLTASVTNSAGITGPLGSVAFFVDTLAPRVSLTAPTNNLTVTGTVLVTGTVTDANPQNWTLAITGPGGYNNTVKFSDNNANAAASTSTSVIYQWNTAKPAGGVLPPSGDYTIKLTGTDQAGNTTQAAATVTVTLMPFQGNPTLQAPIHKATGSTPYSEPVNNITTYYLNGSDVEIKGATNLADSNFLSWALVAAAMPPIPKGGVLTSSTTNVVDYTWDTTQAAAFFANATPLSLTALDTSKEERFSNSYQVVVDNVKPNTGVTGAADVTPPQGALPLYLNGPTHITGAITEANLKSWKFQAAAVVNGVTSPYSDLPGGSTTPAAPGAAATITVDNTGNAWTPPSNTEQDYLIYLNATDKAGNLSVAAPNGALLVHIDTLAPRLALTSSGNVLGFFTTGGVNSFTVTGFVQDANLNHVRLTVTNAQNVAVFTTTTLTNAQGNTIDGVTYTGFTQLVTAMPGTSLQPDQDYTLTLMAIDKAGNANKVTSGVHFLLSPTASLTLATSAFNDAGGPAANITASTTGTPIVTDTIYVGTSFVSAIQQKTADVLTAGFANQTNWILYDNGTLIDDTFNFRPQGSASSTGWTKTRPALPGSIWDFTGANYQLPDGVHSLTLQAFNDGVASDPANGNAGLNGISPQYFTQVQLRNVVVDTAAPTAEIFSPAPLQQAFPGSTLTVYFKIDNKTGQPVGGVRSPLLRTKSNKVLTVVPQVSLYFDQPGGKAYDLTLAVTGTASDQNAQNVFDPMTNGTATLAGPDADGSYTVTWKIPLTDLTRFPANSNHTVTIANAEDVAQNMMTGVTTVTFHIGF